MGCRIGIDVGGTFTDFLIVDETSGQTWLHKTPSTPSDPAQAVADGLRHIFAIMPSPPSEVMAVMHGTTMATNAVLEGRGARVGLLCTAGFEQVLHLARGETPGPLAGWVTMVKPEPIASLELTRGIDERMGAKGDVVRELDHEHARSQVRDLLARNVEVLAISLINAYANPTHEKRLQEIVREIDNDTPISLSTDVLPEFREYERTNIVVMNAYLRPSIGSYLRGMEAELETLGLDCSLLVLRSDGGLMSARAASERPVHTLFSGPAGGVAGALRVARAAGFPNFLSLDIGGTSTDVALCLDGEPVITRDTKLGLFPVKAPSIDVRSVGAGGGSVAHVPEVTRALRVGPESAGAVPGPACYGLGGRDSTVTDANLVLGYLPEKLLGGKMTLSRERATSAIQKVAEQLELTLEEAAEGIVAVVNENIVGALRLVSVEKGHDPRDLALVAFGGAGPLHANAVAQLMGTFPVIVPPTPGVLAALGDAFSPLRSEFSETFIRRFDEVSPQDVITRLNALNQRAVEWLTHEGAAAGLQDVRLSVDARYHRQALEMPLEVEVADLETHGFCHLADRFADQHEREYGFRLDTVCEFVNLRAIALGGAEIPMQKALPNGSRAEEAALLGTQALYHRGSWFEAKVYERPLLPSGSHIEGPAILVQTDSTTVILPGSYGEVDLHLNILINSNLTRGGPGQTTESPIVIDIIENALKNIRREMDAVIFRAAMSTVIREEHDSFPLLSDEHGRMLAGQFGWPLAEFFKDSYPREALKPGDVLMLNDPYLCGGAVQHTPDLLVMRPIFYRSELVGFASQIGNLMDIGGPVPGSMPAQARSIFEEGIRFPPVKLYEQGVLAQPVIDILARNSRTPEVTVADTLALAAATRAAELRVIELCERFGVGTYRAVCERLLERTRRAAQVMISSFIPETPLTFEDCVDDDGRGNGPFKIKIAVWQEDGRAIIDFDGCSPQAEGPINLFMGKAMFKMVTGIILIMALDPQILFNHGYNDLFDVRFPSRSVVQPEFPAPLSNRSHTLARVFDVLQGALAQQNPGLATGAGCGSSPHFLYSGTTGDDDFFFFYEINYGGIPGRPVGDGIDVHAWWPHVTSIPVEYAESYFPLRIESIKARRDSGGAGKHRGGHGVEKVYCFLEAGDVSVHDDRHLSRPWGIGGGRAAHGSEKTLIRVNGDEVVLPAKFDFLQVEPGDRLVYVTAGGGGWGDPLEREPEAVRKDVLRGLVSKESAREDYGIVFQGRDLGVDLSGTEAHRSAIRALRPDELPVFDTGGPVRSGRPMVLNDALRAAINT